MILPLDLSAVTTHGAASFQKSAKCSIQILKTASSFEEARHVACHRGNQKAAIQEEVSHLAARFGDK
jgi:hypothetical protein